MTHISARRADFAVVPIVVVASLVPLARFVNAWIVTPDGSWYLLLAENLISGNGYSGLEGDPVTIRGPVFPGLLGLFMLPLGRNLEELAFAVRLLALVNPVLVYALLKRVAGAPSALLGAAIVAFYSQTSVLRHAFNVDALLVTIVLLAAYVLLRGFDEDRNGLLFASGLLLGLALLTKETAFALVPLAFVGSLLLQWRPRGVALHYIGVAVVAIPWWIWVWSVEGRVYLAERVPPAAALGATAVCVGAVTMLAPAIRRRSSMNVAWWLVAGWIVLVSALLVVAAPDIPNSAQSVANSIRAVRLWYLLPFGAAYLILETARGNRRVGFYTALLALQVPPTLLALEESYAARQYLLPETLLLGGLAGCVVQLIRVSLRGRGRGLAVATAVALALLFVPATLKQTRGLLGGVHGNQGGNEAKPAVQRTGAFIAGEIPQHAGLLTTIIYAFQLAFEDDGRHRWHVLQFDCPLQPRGLAAETCELTHALGERPPAGTVWFYMNARCDAAALSLPTILRQSDRTRSRYLVLTTDRLYPGLLALGPHLARSGAFRTLHSDQGLVVLERTGKRAAAVPTLMSPKTAQVLVRCSRDEKGTGWRGSIRSRFPNGIQVVGAQQTAQHARSLVAEVY